MRLHIALRRLDLFEEIVGAPSRPFLVGAPLDPSDHIRCAAHNAWEKRLRVDSRRLQQYSLVYEPSGFPRIGGTGNPADYLTKGLPKDTFENCGYYSFLYELPAKPALPVVTLGT